MSQLKKRLIFTLLYNSGQFVLSRNFRLQRVGDVKWLQANYNFSKISFSIDELIVLDVSRDSPDPVAFASALKALAQGCFAPIAAGGGIRSVGQARELLRSGADKIVINTPLFQDKTLVKNLACEFGEQCVVASIDLKRNEDRKLQIRVNAGTTLVEDTASNAIREVLDSPVGEIYLNSMDRDGTGQGYDMELLEQLPAQISKPIILAGGAGNATHLAEGLRDPRTDAVATAHLFNFVGDGLSNARQSIINDGIQLPYWDSSILDSLRST